MKKLHELKAKLKAVGGEMRSINHAVVSGEDMSEDQQRSWDAKTAEKRTLEQAIAREEDLRSIDQQFAETVVVAEERPHAEQKPAYDVVFRKWLCHDLSGLNNEERSIMRENRAQSTTTDSAGGFSVPTEFSAKVIEAMKAFGGTANHCQKLMTSHGRTIEWVTHDGTAEKGSLIGENTAVSEEDVTIGQALIQARKLTSNMVRMSNELAQDSEINFENLVITQLASRLARAEADLIVNGDGTGLQNRGLNLAVTLTQTAASSTALTYEDFVELKHKVDPAYRGGAMYAFNDNTLKALKLLKDLDGRPLWKESTRVGEPALIDGTPYFIDQEMADIGTGNKSVFFGNWNNFVLRRVSYLGLRQLSERYAEFDQKAFLSFMRFDTCLEDNKAIAALQHA